MVKTRIPRLPRRLSVQTPIRKPQSRKQKLKIKFFLHPGKIVLPLLINSLWLVFTAASVAQQSSAQENLKEVLAKPPLFYPLTTPQKISQQPPSPSIPRLLASGTQISLNGRTLPAAWVQWQMNVKTGTVATAISDADISQLLGVELLNTSNAAKQPVQWFSQPKITPIVLNSQVQGAYRYLDITQLATLAGWQVANDNSTLRITTPKARVKQIRQGKQTWGDRIVVDLDRPAFWQVTQQPPPPKPKVQLPNLKLPIPIAKPKPPNQEWLIAIDAATDPQLSRSFNPNPVERLLIATQNPPKTETKLETAPNLTTIRLSVPAGLSPRINTLANPNRIVIDLRPDAMVERNILWDQGLRWRQQFVSLGAARFPVVWLDINPQAVGLTLKPIWGDTNALVGIASMIETAQHHTAVAAINGGFFNRNNKYPLGAIRRDGKWLSSPILNRGAIAWNNNGQVKIGRLKLQETLITSTRQRLPILTRNSGYVEPGIAFYSPEWAANYSPITDNETIVIVQNNQVMAQIPGGAAANKAVIPIPRNGYLLALRNNNSAVGLLPIGTVLSQQSATQPDDFARYSQIIGAGPLLIQNKQIVLDAKAEGFSDAFIQEKAARSAICTTKAGNMLIAAIHNRAGGDGPTLAETASVMQQMGCIDALNLDGGSSTSLYLGGQLLNRSPRTAARVHNGLGIFLQPRP